MVVLDQTATEHLIQRVCRRKQQDSCHPHAQGSKLDVC
jgi:hypothetical protein